MIRKARPEDIDSIMEIVKQAQKFLKAQGLDQWQDGYPQRELIEKDVADGIGIVCDERGETAAYAAVFVGREPTYDRIYEGKWPTDGGYGVIHRVCVSKKYRDRGEAGAICAYAAGFCRGAGVTALRVDTHEGNLPMQGMLKKNGFAPCGIILLENGRRRLAFEKAV